MDQIEATLLFLLRHVASHADGPTAKQAQKHLDAVGQEFARAGSDVSVVFAPAVHTIDSKGVNELLLKHGVVRLPRFAQGGVISGPFIAGKAGIAQSVAADAAPATADDSHPAGDTPLTLIDQAPAE